jgi:hypothetical protein
MFTIVNGEYALPIASLCLVGAQAREHKEDNRESAMRNSL